MPNLYGKKEPLPLPPEPEKCETCNDVGDWLYMGRWGNRQTWWECKKCNILTIEPSEI
jgi:hypothetical protein